MVNFGEHLGPNSLERIGRVTKRLDEERGAKKEAAAWAKVLEDALRLAENKPEVPEEGEDDE